jgi:hypothetical protein
LAVRTLVNRLARLEERIKATGDCPVCRGEPPWAIQYHRDDGETGPLSRDPCPGCGELNVVEVAYTSAPALEARSTGGV